MNQKGQTGILILAGIVILVALAGGIFYLGRVTAPKPQPQNVVTSSPQPSPSPTDETANWKTYTNTKYGYSIKYPSEIKLITSDENAVEFYRENAGIGAGMGERGHGMVIYYRNFGAETTESQSRPIENIFISSYPAFRWTDNNSCMEDIWLPNPNKSNTLRISFTTCAEKEPYNKIDFDLFDQILSTFKFTD